MGTVTGSSELAEEAAARSGTYRLLARLWLREVDRDLIQALGAPPLRHSFAEAGGVLPSRDDDRTIELLAIEYCRLFIGPTGHLPPYQSVWQHGQFHGATTASMERIVEAVRYDINALPNGMMLDHFGVQLDVMGHLLGQFSASSSDPKRHEFLSELVLPFFTANLSWPADLLQAAARRASTNFYRSIILLTGAFLESER